MKKRQRKKNARTLICLYGSNVSLKQARQWARNAQKAMAHANGEHICSRRILFKRSVPINPAKFRSNHLKQFLFDEPMHPDECSVNNTKRTQLSTSEDSSEQEEPCKD